MRSSCIVGLLDRPLCLALIAGICTSDWALALSLGIILELLWLDVLELGSVVPPFGSLRFLLYALCYALLFCLLAVLTARQALPQLLVLNWPMLYAAALMGAVLSLRTHRAYMVLVGSLGTLALLIWVEEKGLF